MLKPRITIDNHLEVINDLHPSYSVKLALIDRGYGSSYQIFEQPESFFIEDVKDILPQEEARHVYEKAKYNYTKLTHMVTALNINIGSNPCRGIMNGKNQDSAEGDEEWFQKIPNYQKIFSNLDYCTCPHCKSIFGPAAYFVDLMRIIDKHIILVNDGRANDKGIPLKDRRQDLFNLILSCENTNQVKPYIEIVNGILEPYLTRNGYPDIYKKLASVQYPASLPFYLPMEQLRVWLGNVSLQFTDVLDAFNYPKKVLAAEEMGLTEEQFTLLSNPLAESILPQFFGETSIDYNNYSNLPYLLKKLELTYKEFRELLEQNITEDGQDWKTYRHQLFINQNLPDMKYIKIVQQDIEGQETTKPVETVENIQKESLESLARFIRFSRHFNLSYEDADWLIKIAFKMGRDGFVCAGNILAFARRFGLCFNEVSVLFGTVKDYGSNPFFRIFGRTRKQLETLTAPDEIDRFLAKQLKTDFSNLTLLRAYHGSDWNVDSAYRHIVVARMMALGMEEYIMLLKITFDTPITAAFTPQSFSRLIAMRTGTRFSVRELEYFVHLVPSDYVKPAFTMEAFNKKLEYMKKVCPPEPAEEKELEDFVYGELASFFAVSAVEVKDLFGCILDEERLGIWPALIMERKKGDINIEQTVHNFTRYHYMAKAGMNPQVLRLLLNKKYQSLFGISDQNKVSARNVLDLEAFQNYMELFQDHDKKLLKFLDDYQTRPTNFKALSQVTGWEEKELNKISAAWKTDEGETRTIVAVIDTLSSGMLLINKLAINGDSLSSLLSCSENKVENYDKLDAAVKQLCAPSMDQELMAALEKRKRDALLPIAIRTLGKKYVDIDNAGKLYQYFLIDVEMDDKTLISPVKEAINALQLYLQRCNMRLERGIKEVTIPSVWWSWVMDYRQWEANRKIFVYPENYLIPSVRNSKTTLFREVEDALQQSKLTESYIEEQYVKYLDEYYDLTQLIICGAYETTEDNRNVLYVFARTSNRPYTYFYCKQVSTLAWTEWKKIDTNIDAETITPVYVFNRLHIFWSVLREKTKVKVETAGSMKANNQRAYEFQINYTYLNLQGKWIAPQTLTEDLIVFSEEDSQEKSIEDCAKKFGFFHEESFHKMTLLKLTQQNLGGFKNKGREYECLAVFVGSYSQNLGEEIKYISPSSNLDREQKAFTERLNQIIKNNNYETKCMNDGYLSTGFLKIFNEDLEEDYFVHQNEFKLVDGYVPPDKMLMYTPLYDEIHHAVGVYLSQNVLRDAALPTNGILPYQNNANKSQPRLNEKSFMINGQGGEQIITEEMSKKIFERLKTQNVINSDGIVDEMILRSSDLLTILNNIFLNTDYSECVTDMVCQMLLKNQEQNFGPGSFICYNEAGEELIGAGLSDEIFKILSKLGILQENTLDKSKDLPDKDDIYYILRSNLNLIGNMAVKYKQIQEIQRILLKNIGAVYLFQNAASAQLIPVINQPGKFIFDCGDEAFLVYPVYKKEEKYHSFNFEKTDAGVAVGNPMTPAQFVKMGFSLRTALDIRSALKSNKLINENNIVNLNECTYEQVKNALNGISGIKKEDFRKCYMALQNFPFISREELKNVLGADVDNVCKCLTDILYEWNANPLDYRIDIRQLATNNYVTLIDHAGGRISDQVAAKLFKTLQSAACSVGLNYHSKVKLPDDFEKEFRYWKFGVQRLTNPTIKKLRRKLEIGGISSFLTRKTQEAPDEPVMPFDRLGPSENIIKPAATDGAQVDFEGLYEEYNWELFYHIPMTIADSFSSGVMYQSSMKWLHYIFNPTLAPDDRVKKYYWNFLPFTMSEEETLKQILTSPTAIRAYNDSPYDPHAIARLRLNAYAKYTVIQYVHNILQWADSQFILNTWESLTSATMLYIWASDLLGPKPQAVGVFKQGAEKSYQQIKDSYHGGEIEQFLIKVEETMKKLCVGDEPITIRDEVPVNDIKAFFGVPENDQLLVLWDIVEDRLYKLRNSLDINGAHRTTSLFEPPADPMALVKAAAAAGGDSPGGLSKRPSLYPYRFRFMIEQAKALTSQLISFSASLLSALEKKDAEGMLLLTGAQERTLLTMTTSIRENQLQEAENAIAILKASREAAEIKQKFYETNAEEFISKTEVAALVLSGTAGVFQAMAGNMKFIAGAASLVPQIGSPLAMTYGGQEVGACFSNVAAGYEIVAGATGHASQMLSTIAQYNRRQEEWKLQKQLADKEIKGYDEQIENSQIRIKIARKELEIQKKTAEQKDEVLSYLKSKFSGNQLYQWLSGRLTGTVWQAYQLALELGTAAQEAYRYERDEDDTFLQFDYWDSGRRGLAAGECLMHALNQMEQSYHKKNRRRLEIEKNISLKRDCSDAFNMLLAKGECNFILNERLYAQDYPSGYRRKLTNISISIPAVLPPYETIRAILRQTNSHILMKPDMKGIDYLFNRTGNDPGSGIVREIKRNGEKIAVSRGIDDSGMFTLNFADERYLPFEGTGADSEWKLEIPEKTNSFKLDTLTDVIITVRYTALEDEGRGNGSFYDAVSKKINGGN